jgi:Zn-dependent peptidase ImmA (M78 family)
MARIEALVRRMLQEHRIESAPVPVDQIARKLGAEVRYIPFQGQGSVSAMLFRDKTHKVIGVNSLHHPNRQRFSIAHEIAHLLLHKGKELHVDRTIFLNLRDDVSSQAVDPDEIEANRFAAELLMPKNLILKDVKQADIDLENEDDLLDLARRYRVSIQALTFRLANLGLISSPRGL